MGLFNRKPKLAADKRPPLERDERMLSWAATSNGDGVVVVTNRGLWLPGRAHRLGWHDVNKAVWSGRELAVTPAETIAERDGYLVVADLPVETYLLLEPGDVPHQVRARVTSSVSYTAHHRLAAGGGVRVAARRVSGVDGLRWTVRYDVGTSTDEPSVLEQTAAMVAGARDTGDPGALPD
ncbi:hypothetical protein OG792_25985 [Micromonospora sp. NBC_01699]|uniref:hypothetical protein n=1 Tax=Micromonospora sp. NBC_01699 TaxID=2975984 RepID=UPI002E2B0EEB|nr:hypothetical protein [Micromonospora sp. NBC_01699]